MCDEVQASSYGVDAAHKAYRAEGRPAATQSGASLAAGNGTLLWNKTQG
jgi:hypothetical protein